VGLFGLPCLMFVALAGAKKMADLAQTPAHPATVEYAWLFARAKVLTTLVSVAIGTWHPKLSCLAIILINLGLFVYVLKMRPFVHSFMNRFVANGFLYNIICYASAWNAADIDDPTSVESVVAFTRLALGTLALCATYETQRFATDQEGDGRWHSAGAFKEVYQVADEETMQKDDPVDKEAAEAEEAEDPRLAG